MKKRVEARTDLVYYFPVSFNEEEGGSTADFGIPSTREELLALNGQMATGNPEEAKSFLVREVPELDCVLVIITNDWHALDQAVDETGAGVFVIIILTFAFNHRQEKGNVRSGQDQTDCPVLRDHRSDHRVRIQLVLPFFEFDLS